MPAIEVKRDYAQILSDTIRIFFKGEKRQDGIKTSRFFEKSIVRPDFHLGEKSTGKVTISEAALTQMIFHCIDEYDDDVEVNRVKIQIGRSGYSINLMIVVPYGKTLTSDLEKLRKYIQDTIQRYTGIVIEMLEISVDKISERQKK